MDAWPFLAQAPVVLRATTGRPYGYACAGRLHGGVRSEGELPEGQEKPLWSAPPYGMGSMYAELLK